MGRPIQNSLLSLVPNIGEYLVSDIDPGKVSIYSKDKYVFRCIQCGTMYTCTVCGYVKGTHMCRSCITRNRGSSLLNWAVTHNIYLELENGIDQSIIKSCSRINKIRVRCGSGHVFAATPYDITHGKWCPYCARSRRISKPALCLYLYTSRYRDCILEYVVPGTRYSVDLYFPLFNMGIEFDGQHFHTDSDHDADKNKKCSEAGIKILRIREPGCSKLDNTNVYTLQKQVRTWRDLEECRWWVDQELNIKSRDISFESAWNQIYAFLYRGVVPNNAYEALSGCSDGDILVSGTDKARSLRMTDNLFNLEFKCTHCGFKYSTTSLEYIRYNKRCPVCSRE